ncbi:MAG: hypothetical protein J0J01_14100 [Reyranella sp.]|uniref:hypothetical protein n=1 Tax=Reyranella sp. TaxID=1929291 RepID=UPI001AC1BDDF|nr:hypothetical protein [Reyranella sp.]MBN9088039.1 hypothetical protein [Reyranella sp.]
MRNQEEADHPEELRELARRVRVIAACMNRVEAARLRGCADIFEALATRLERSTPCGPTS